MFSTDFIFKQKENLVDNHKYQTGFRPLCNKILLLQNKPIVHIANVLSVNTVQIVLCWLKVLSTYILHMPKEDFYTILDIESRYQQNRKFNADKVIKIKLDLN